MDFKLNVYSLNLGVQEYKNQNYEGAIAFFGDEIDENPVMNLPHEKSLSYQKKLIVVLIP